MDIPRFQKKIEDFVCEVCDTKNVGNGYTNHCRNCLRSKHVDIFPGDRKENCGGIMNVTAITKKGERYVIEHTCSLCGQVNGDHVRSEDEFNAVIGYVQKTNDKLAQQ